MTALLPPIPRLFFTILEPLSKYAHSPPPGSNPTPNLPQQHRRLSLRDPIPTRILRLSNVPSNPLPSSASQHADHNLPTRQRVPRPRADLHRRAVHHHRDQGRQELDLRVGRGRRGPSVRYGRGAGLGRRAPCEHLELGHCGEFGRRGFFARGQGGVLDGGLWASGGGEGEEGVTAWRGFCGRGCYGDGLSLRSKTFWIYSLFCNWLLPY